MFPSCANVGGWGGLIHHSLEWPLRRPQALLRRTPGPYVSYLSTLFAIRLLPFPLLPPVPVSAVCLLASLPPPLYLPLLVPLRGPCIDQLR